MFVFVSSSNLMSCFNFFFVVCRIRVWAAVLGGPRRWEWLLSSLPRVVGLVFGVAGGALNSSVVARGDRKTCLTTGYEP